MFRDNACSSSKRLSDLYFYLTKANGWPVDTTVAGTTITNLGHGTYYSQISSVTGQGWIDYENLPAGKYTVVMGQFSNIDYKK
jgi:hypothetical protein